MTEDEARKKWCPMVRKRYDGADEPACNMRSANWAEKEDHPKCIASACMMWEEYPPMCQDPKTGRIHAAQEPRADYAKDYIMLPPSGDCGLKR